MKPDKIDYVEKRKIDWPNVYSKALQGVPHGGLPTDNDA